MALHDGLLELHGQAPYDIEVRWVYGPPLPLGLDPEAREVMIRERIATIFERLSVTWEPPEAAEPGAARRSRDSAPAALP